MRPPLSEPFRVTAEGLLLFIRVTPNAGADRIDGFESRDDGTSVLRLRVKAVPDKGKANAAAIALLSKALGLPRSQFQLLSGDTARFKTVLVRGDGAALAIGLAALAGPAP